MASTPAHDTRSETATESTLAAPDGRAWNDAELANPHTHTEKAVKVRSMFGAIAHSYDLNNRLHSLWQDVRWRRFAVRVAEVRAGDAVLDVACGTGDLTQEFARSNAGSVVGVDFTPAMLEIARHKHANLGRTVRPKITYMDGDAQHLEFPDASFDVVSIAFGIRNVAEPARALREFARVLRPGGRLVILEFEPPKNPLVRWMSDMYCGRVMPMTATAIARDKSGAYKYLPKSVASFLTREAMLNSIREAGMSDCRTWSLTLGICTCYRAIKSNNFQITNT